MFKIKITLLSALIVAGLGVSAQEKNVADIGAPIAKETAQAWTENFKIQNVNAVYGHTYGKKMLGELLDTKDIAGVYIFNALDGNGHIKLIFKAANEDGDVIGNGVAYDSGLPCPPTCPPPVGDNLADVGAKIEEGLAQQMIQNFQNTHKERAYSQLFGTQIFENMLAIEGTEGMYFGHAIDDKGHERMVIVALDGNGNWQDPPGDSGLPCPPTCPDDYPPAVVSSVK